MKVKPKQRNDERVQMNNRAARQQLRKFYNPKVLGDDDAYLDELAPDQETDD